MTIAGEGLRPGIEHIQAVARSSGISDAVVSTILERTRAAVNNWPEFASEAGVAKKTAAAIDSVLNGLRQRSRRPKIEAK